MYVSIKEAFLATEEKLGILKTAKVFSLSKTTRRKLLIECVGGFSDLKGSRLGKDGSKFHFLDILWSYLLPDTPFLEGCKLARRTVLHVYPV